jgi:glycerol kinase
VNTFTFTQRVTCSIIFRILSTKLPQNIAVQLMTSSNRWHEHDPLELISSVNGCIEEAVKIFIKKGFSPKQIKAVGITNQRETTVVWDSQTGQPLYNAYVSIQLGLTPAYS